MRGAGFIWSPMLRRAPYTSHHLMHITDWLPTLLHVASSSQGSDSFSLPRELDGLDQWDALSNDLRSPRSEILLNIDPEHHASAVRVGDMKLLSASRGTTRRCDGWYPTDDINRDPCKDGTLVRSRDNSQDGSTALNVTVVRDRYQPMTLHFINNNRPTFTNDHTVRPAHLNEVAHPQHSRVTSLLEKIGRKPLYAREPLSVKCGARPANATSNCKPWLAACLFNITADPCEYENLATSRPHVVNAMQRQLQFYREHAVTPLNKPVDDTGLPYHHNWTWVPWR